MTLVKFTQTGQSLYINSEHVAVVSPHAQLIGTTNVTLANGINVAVEGNLAEVIEKLGHKLAWVSK